MEQLKRGLRTFLTAVSDVIAVITFDIVRLMFPRSLKIGFEGYNAAAPTFEGGFKYVYSFVIRFLWIAVAFHIPTKRKSLIKNNSFNVRRIFLMVDLKTTVVMGAFEKKTFRFQIFKFMTIRKYVCAHTEDLYLNRIDFEDSKEKIMAIADYNRVDGISYFYMLNKSPLEIPRMFLLIKDEREETENPPIHFCSLDGDDKVDELLRDEAKFVKDFVSLSDEMKKFMFVTFEPNDPNKPTFY